MVRSLNRMSQPEHTELSETELVARSIDGDAGAFGTLYERYLGAIYRYVYYSVPDHAEAEDLTENVFIKAWQALPRFHLKGPGFRTWLYRIAHNAIIDRHRTRKETAPIEAAAHLRDPAPMPENVVERNQEMLRLSAALGKLRPRARQVISVPVYQRVEPCRDGRGSGRQRGTRAGTTAPCAKANASPVDGGCGSECESRQRVHLHSAWRRFKRANSRPSNAWRAIPSTATNFCR